VQLRAKFFDAAALTLDEDKTAGEAGFLIEDGDVGSGAFRDLGDRRILLERFGPDH
jgi:hypothetical protein